MLFTVSTAPEQYGPKSSGGMPQPTWRRPSPEISCTIFRGSRYISTVISTTRSAKKYNLVVDCLKKSWPDGALAKKRLYSSLRKYVACSSVKLAMRCVRALSNSFGRPSCPFKILSTFSHSQFHATSCSVSQSFGASDLRVASITARKSGRTICSGYLESTRRSTSHSSCSRVEFAMFRTMASNWSKTIPIHLELPYPMTAALNMNISRNELGTFIWESWAVLVAVLSCLFWSSAWASSSF
mmetsp:Transcript_51224/g.119504  ORF Transcript_51224/g.119504 Transcript_51224/m.119504 type:complete len:241 (-) Transcript_51224:831-1553(-)